MAREDIKKSETHPREFQILGPGDEYTTMSLTDKPMRVVLGESDRVIRLDPETAIVLKEWKGYYVVEGINVQNIKQGIGTALYEEALKLAKAEGKKGILSLPYERTPDAERRWNRFKEQGRVSIIKDGADEYEVILV